MDIPNLVDKFSGWLEEEVAPGTIADGITMMSVLVSKMRMVLTYEELHDLVHHIVEDVSTHLQGMVDDPDDDTFVVLAEQWRGMEDGFEFITSGIKGIPDTLPPEWEADDE